MKSRGRRLRARWRASRLFRWMAAQERVLWVSVIVPTDSALNSGPPSLADYRGLRALMEFVTGPQTFEWRLVWSSDWAADRHEDQFAKAFGESGAYRVAIRSVEIPIKPWWRQTLPLTVIATLLAGIATAIANVATLKNVYVELSHAPEAKVESTIYTLRAASDMRNQLEIVVRGDSFFRSRMSETTMQITPDPSFPDTKALSDKTPVALSEADRSLDISEKMTLTLPINYLPAGHYLVRLRGKLATEWKSAQFAPRDILLEVRSPVALSLYPIPWGSADSTQQVFSDALLDIVFLFGRVNDATSTVNVFLPGHWTGYSFVKSPVGAMAEEISQNSADEPKSIAFTMKYLPSKSFSTQFMRIKVSAAAPMTREAWRTAFANAFAQFN